MEFEKKKIEDVRADAYVEYERSQQLDVMLDRYTRAVTASDAEEAADAARAYRNKLLDECDNMMVSDRPNVATDAWGSYRQDLRDVPSQDGFPLNINWPERP